MDVVDETDNITLHSRGLTLGPALLTRQVRLGLSNRKLTRVKVESSGEQSISYDIVPNLSKNLGNGIRLQIRYATLSECRTRGF